jgi:hypothetical protein
LLHAHAEGAQSLIVMAQMSRGCCAIFIFWIGSSTCTSAPNASAHSLNPAPRMIKRRFIAAKTRYGAAPHHQATRFVRLALPHYFPC